MDPSPSKLEGTTATLGTTSALQEVRQSDRCRGLDESKLTFIPTYSSCQCP